MKLTKQQLKQIIKEEISIITEGISPIHSTAVAAAIANLAQAITNELGTDLIDTQTRVVDVIEKTFYGETQQ